MPKIVDRDERRAQVAAAVWRVISRHGVEGTTVRLIAVEAGCSTGVLAHYFADKDELLRHALSEAFARAERRMRARADRRPGAAALRAVACEALPLDGARRTEWLVWMAFWSRANASKGLRQEHAERYEAYRGALRTLIERGRADGSLRRDLDPTDAADELSALIDGLGLQAVLEPRRLTARAQTARLDRYLRANLLP